MIRSRSLELHEHAIGGAHVLVHQRRDRVQRVEQEVRVQLLLQRLSAGLRRACASSCTARTRARARLTVVEERMAQARRSPSTSSFPSRSRAIAERCDCDHHAYCAPVRTGQPPVHGFHAGDVRNENTMTAGTCTASARSRPPRSNWKCCDSQTTDRRHQRPEIPPAEIEHEQRAERRHRLARTAA